MARILYLTYDGLTDPLGQSQVLPYIDELANLGHIFSVISFEKKGNTELIEQTKKLLDENQVQWYGLHYTKSPPILSTIWDLYRLRKLAFRKHKEHPFEIVHCRSYITSLVGLALKRQTRLKFIFDMRDFWPDERVDGGLWNLKNPVFRMIYKYFKSKETHFYKTSDHIIALTEKAKKIISAQVDSKKISVIPTSVDISLFKYPDPAVATNYQHLKICKEDFVISYLGSIGSWYRTIELLKLYNLIIQMRPTAKLLVITKSPTQEFLLQAEDLGTPTSNIIITNGSRTDIPYLIGFSNWSVFFYSSSPAKAGTSPTKMAEIISQKIPVVSNAGVGDLDTLFARYRLGILVRDLDDQRELENTARFMCENPEYRSDDQLVYDLFDLKKACKKLSLIYEEVMSCP